MTPSEALSLVQGSPEWLELRAGMVTASRLKDVIAMLKRGGESADRARYRQELIVEILTKQPYPQYVSTEMQWGVDQEPFARAAYELKYGVMLDTVGFVLHPTILRFGCSPDGLVGNDGIVEIKCPNTTTHLAWMLARTIPVEHIPQMLGGLACNPTRQWSDFVSFDPRLPHHLQLFVRRLDRNDKLISALEREVEHFNSEIDQVLQSLPPAPTEIAEVLEWPKNDEVEL